MEPPRVYIETTIPSAYFDTRTAPEMIRRREATRRWWADAGERYELVTSVTVREELENGPAGRREAWLDLIEPLSVLGMTPAIEVITAAYAQHKVMPRNDALHLALASSYWCDYLLTWDFKHLANPNKFRHIQAVNARLKLPVPRIIAPLALGGNHE